MDELEIPQKLFYSIGEVSEITKAKPHVLRYWESEFKILTPEKNSTGQRVYRKKDIDIILIIQHLLYQEKFTIAGAKKQLKVELEAKTAQQNQLKRSQDLTASLKLIRQELQAIKDLMVS